MFREKFIKNDLVKIVQNVLAFDFQDSMSGIVAKDNSLRFCLFNQNSAVQIRVDNVEVHQPKSIGISFKTFLNAVKDFADTNIYIYLDESNPEYLVIENDSGKTLEIRIKHTEFSNEVLDTMLNISDNVDVLLFDYSTISDVSKKVSYAVRNDNMSVMSGICLDLEKVEQGVVNFVATDGVRLSLLRDIQVEIEKKSEKRQSSIVIPVQFFKNLTKILPENQKYQFIIDYNENKLIVKDSNNFITISTLLIEGKFPDYKSVFPNNDKYAFIEREILINYIKSISFSKDSTTVRVLFSKDFVQIESESEITKAKTRINCQYSFEDFSFYINSTYLLDVLKSLDSGFVKISFLKESSPIMVEETDNHNFSSLIMPISKS